MNQADNIPQTCMNWAWLVGPALPSTTLARIHTRGSDESHMWWHHALQGRACMPALTGHGRGPSACPLAHVVYQTECMQRAATHSRAAPRPACGLFGLCWQHGWIATYALGAWHLVHGGSGRCVHGGALPKAPPWRSPCMADAQYSRTGQTGATRGNRTQFLRLIIISYTHMSTTGLKSLKTVDCALRSTRASLCAVRAVTRPYFRNCSGTCTGRLRAGA